MSKLKFIFQFLFLFFNLKMKLINFYFGLDFYLILKVNEKILKIGLRAFQIFVINLFCVQYQVLQNAEICVRKFIQLELQLLLPLFLKELIQVYDFHIPSILCFLKY